MIDTTYVPLAYAFLVVAAIVSAVAVAAIAVALRDLRASSATPVLVTVSGPSDHGYTRAA